MTSLLHSSLFPSFSFMNDSFLDFPRTSVLHILQSANAASLAFARWNHPSVTPYVVLSFRRTRDRTISFLHGIRKIKTREERHSLLLARKRRASNEGSNLREKNFRRFSHARWSRMKRGRRIKSRSESIKRICFSAAGGLRIWFPILSASFYYNVD